MSKRSRKPSLTDKPAVQNNTIIADTGSVHKLQSILPKFLTQISLLSLQK